MLKFGYSVLRGRFFQILWPSQNIQTLKQTDWSINLEKFTLRENGECGVSLMKESFFYISFCPWIVQRYIEETEILAPSIVTVHCIGDRHTQLRGTIMNFSQTRPTVIEGQLKEKVLLL